MGKLKLRWFVYAAIAVSTVAVISDSHAQAINPFTPVINNFGIGNCNSLSNCISVALAGHDASVAFQCDAPDVAELESSAGPVNPFGQVWQIDTFTVCPGGSSIRTMWQAVDPCGNAGVDADCAAPPPPECDGARAGEKYQQVFFGTGGGPATQCDTGSNCVANRGGGMCLGSSGDCVFDYTISSTTCGTGDTDFPVAAKNTLCVSSGAGVICVDPDDTNNAQGANCGFYNDSYICTDQAADDNCVGLIDGSLGCDDTAPVPPAPDDGITPGSPAAPDESLIDGAGDVTNIYNNSTVNGSTGPTSGTDQGDGSSGQGEGIGGCDPATEYCGDGTYTSGTNCDVPPVCAGEAILCGIVLENWRAGCQDIGTPAEILSDTGLTGLDDAGALDGTPLDLSTGLDDSGWFGTRTCDLDLPVDLGFFGEHTFIFSQWCSLFAFGGVLVLVSAGLGSLRIISGGF